MTRPPTRLAAYARAIERLWSESQDRAVVLSPKEWRLVCQWYERGIPLRVVEEALAGDDRRSRSRGSVRSLAYFAPAVEEGWRVIVEGRLPVVPTPDDRAAPPEPARGIECWRRRREAEQRESPLRRLLDDLLLRHGQGEVARELDRRLDERLPGAVSEPQLRQARKSVERRLSAHRGTMAADVLEATRRRAIVEQLRRSLALPRLEEGLTPQDSRPPQPNASGPH